MDLKPAEWEAPVNLGPVINTASSELQLGIAPEREVVVRGNKPSRRDWRSGHLGIEQAA